MKYADLVTQADEARKRAYAPYSNFSVGAALLCVDGSIYTGCNVENASYGLTICAERVAIFKAVGDGKTEFTAIAIAAKATGGEPCGPCGACRQVMYEFAPNLEVIMGNTIVKISELLPGAFGPKSL